MERLGDWGAAVSGAFTQLLERVIHYLPSIAGAFLLLVVGWVLARLLRTVAVRAAVALDRLLSRVSTPRGTAESKLPASSASILGSIVFWVVLLFFVTAATQVLGLDAFTAWLAGVANYLPTLFAGTLIIAAGLLLSSLARDLVVATPAIAGPKQRELLGRAAQAVVLVTAILVGAEQIGIKVTFLIVIAAAAGGTVAASVALALSLGARTYVANLIGGHHFRQMFSVGQRVRVAGFEGRILELTPVSVILETDEGRITLPAKIFGEEPIVLKIGEESHD